MHTNFLTIHRKACPFEFYQSMVLIARPNPASRDKQKIILKSIHANKFNI